MWGNIWNLTTAKTDIIVRYRKFLLGLKTSPSKEIRVLCNLLINDVRSILGDNLRYVTIFNGLDPMKAGRRKLEALDRRKTLDKYNRRILDDVVELLETLDSLMTKKDWWRLSSHYVLNNIIVCVFLSIISFQLGYVYWMKYRQYIDVTKPPAPATFRH